MNSLIEITATLISNPYPDLPKLCSARTLPLESEVDFEAMSTLPVNSNPILLNFDDHYRLVCDLLACMDQFETQLETVLLRMQMPAGGRMPKEFLDERVLMLQELRGEESVLRSEGKTYLAIEDYLARHPLEAGSNQLRIRLYCPEHQQTSYHGLMGGLAAKLLDLGFEDVATSFMDGAV